MEEKGKYLEEVLPDNKYQIRDESSPRDYFSQIPNLVDILELSPHAYRLYGRLRKVAGETGKCWQSTHTLARACNMSAGKVSESKRELENVYPPLIRIESKNFEKGQYHEIAITDIWQINHDFFTGKDVTIKTSAGVVFHNMNEWSSSQYEQVRSQYETKKNPIKEEPNNDFSKKEEILQDVSIDWKIAKDLEISEESQKKREIEHNALVAFEKSFNCLTQLAWYSGKQKWTQLRKNVVGLYSANPNCFEDYKVWRLTPYVKGAVSLKDVQRDPDLFMASFAAFLESAPSGTGDQKIRVDESGKPETY